MPDEYSGTGNPVAVATAVRENKTAPLTASGDNSPATPHPVYTKLQERWEKCRALWDGTPAIREGGTTYLLRFANESDESYEFRKQLVALFNAYQRTVNAAVGMLLETEPDLGDDMPLQLVNYAEDINLRGHHLSVYAKDITQDHVIDGLVATLVDYPRVEDPGKTSPDDEKRNNLRPYFVKYTRADTLKVMYGKVGGVRVKTLVVFREVLEELEGNFGVNEITEYLVFRRSQADGITWERWRDEETGSATRTEGPSRMLGTSRIPVSLFGEFDALPPLENLADLNIEHHNLKTNHRNLEMLAFVPTQVRIGASKDPETNEYPEIELGPRGTIEAPYIEGLQRPLYWHSPDVSVLEPGERSIQDVKDDMGSAGMAFLAPDKRVAETAEAKRIDAAAQNANLSTVGRRLQDHLEECFAFAAEMIKEVGGSVTVNTEFEESPLTAGEMAQYLAAFINGAISQETFIEAWKRGKRLDESLDVAGEVRKVLSQNARQLEDEPTPADEVGDGDREEQDAAA